MNDPMKTYPLIGCCGIDCVLCPRYHTDGPSACPGCGGPSFKEKHPSCGFVTCCVTKHGFEVCSDCEEYPCNRFDQEKEGYDSFVTHQKVFDNLDMIREHGMDTFLEQQKIRANLLTTLLEDFNEGRSKSYFCLACALLSVSDIHALKETLPEITPQLPVKEKNKIARSLIDTLARGRGIDLKLRK